MLKWTLIHFLSLPLPGSSVDMGIIKGWENWKEVHCTWKLSHEKILASSLKNVKQSERQEGETVGPSAEGQIQQGAFIRRCC